MMEQKPKNRISRWIPGWNLLSVLENDRVEYHLNGWSIAKAKVAV
jgi:hypothetical protein